ncbi:MAG: LptA/OstA family protein [Bacillota bacterium]
MRRADAGAGPRVAGRRSVGAPGRAVPRFARRIAPCVAPRRILCLALCAALAAGLVHFAGPAQVQAQGQAYSQVQAQAQAQAPPKSDPQASGGGPFEMTADEVRYRGKDKVTVADGNVLILYRSFKITGDHAEYDDRVPCVRVRSKDASRFEDTKEKTVLAAVEMVFYLSEEKVDASGNVAVNYQDGRVLASGDHITYLGKEKKGLVTGNARVEMGRKVFAAGNITVLFAEEAVIATGGTRTVIPAEEIKAPGGSPTGNGQ